MAIETKVTCDVCRNPINTATVEVGRIPSGYGLRWSALHMVPGRLEANPKWTDCPIHLCRTCIVAVANFANDLGITSDQHR